jgi:hypothetical protein
MLSIPSQRRWKVVAPAPPLALENKLISKLEGPQTTESTLASDADLSIVSSNLIKIVKDCICAAYATQRDKIKRIIAT